MSIKTIIKKHINYIKIIAFLAVIIPFSVCELLNDSVLSGDLAEIEIDPIVNFVAEIAYSIDGTISTSNEISSSNINIYILNNSGTDVTDTYFTINKTDFGSKTSIDIKNDLELTITSKSGMPTGSYTLKISVTIDSKTNEKKVNFILNKKRRNTPKN